MAIDNRTGIRLGVLESETHGDLALGTTTIVGGWKVRTLPSGEKIATSELDYNHKSDINTTGFEWSTENLAYFQEIIPNGIFTEVYSCECK